VNAWLAFFGDLREQWPLIAAGLGRTLLLATTVSVSGLLLGLVVLYLDGHRNALVRRLTQAYVSFFIGTPLLVLLFLMYYGLPRWGVSLTPFTIAFVGFTLNIGAYNARYLATARDGLDAAELEAARAQGFSELGMFRLIVLPQVLRLSVPALTNQVILNLKDTSIAFLIQYTEFFARMQELASSDFQFLRTYLVAAAVYLALVSAIVLAARQLESRVRLPGVHQAR
jgi:polar amino acid transport system permease protein